MSSNFTRFILQMLIIAVSSVLIILLLTLLSGCVSVGTVNYNNDLRSVPARFVDTISVSSQIKKKIEIQTMDTAGIIKISFLLVDKNGYRTFVNDSVFDAVELNNYIESVWIKENRIEVYNN